ncbi:MAG TPA: hypothetical protein VMV92_25650 [Streptosporangiaceae bacterium]|nr:hypothetical protein [Streptosporangiaceae bacterium]
MAFPLPDENLNPVAKAQPAKRCAEAGARPRAPRAAEPDDHIPRNWLRRSVWLPACQAADLGFNPRVHDTLPDADDTALDAFTKIRTRSGGQSA